MCLKAAQIGWLRARAWCLTIGFCTVDWLTGRTTLGMWPTFHTAEEDISQTRTLSRSDLCLTQQPYRLTNVRFGVDRRHSIRKSRPGMWNGRCRPDTADRVGCLSGNSRLTSGATLPSLTRKTDNPNDLTADIQVAHFIVDESGSNSQRYSGVSSTIPRFCLWTNVAFGLRFQPVDATPTV